MTTDDVSLDDYRHTLVVVVVIATSLIIIITLFLVSRLLIRPRSVPLPPIQPLAHHRGSKIDSYTFSSQGPRFILPIPSLSSSQTSFNSSESNFRFPPNSPFRPYPTSSPSPSRNLGPSISHRSGHQTLYGVPHALHSQVEIVLPPPLSPSFVPLGRVDNIRWANHSSDRIDKWIPIGWNDYNSSSLSRQASSSTPSSSCTYLAPTSLPPLTRSTTTPDG